MPNSRTRSDRLKCQSSDYKAKSGRVKQTRSNVIVNNDKCAKRQTKAKFECSQRDDLKKDVKAEADVLIQSHRETGTKIVKTLTRRSKRKSEFGKDTRAEISSKHDVKLWSEDGLNLKSSLMYVSGSQERSQEKRSKMNKETFSKACQEENNFTEVGAGNKISLDDKGKSKTSVKHEMKGKLSESVNQNKLQSDNLVRRSSRSRTSKSALELLGIKVKRERISKQPSEIKMLGLKELNTSESLREVDNLSVPKSEDGNKPFGVPDSSEELEERVDVWKDKSTKKESNIALVESISLRNVVASKRDASQETCDASGQKTNLMSGGNMDQVDVNKTKDNQVKLKAKPVIKSETTMMIADQPHSNTSSHMTSATGVGSVSESHGLSRSGRLLLSPRKYNEYSTAGGKRTEIARQKVKFDQYRNSNLMLEKEELSSSALPRKREREGFNNVSDCLGKRMKVIRQTNGAVTVCDNQKHESTRITEVASEGNEMCVKSELNDVSDERVYIHNDPEENQQLMPSEIIHEDKVMMMEGILDKSGDMTEVKGGSAVVQGKDSDELPEEDQLSFVASTVVIKSDPDMHQNQVSLVDASLHDGVLLSHPTSNSRNLASEEQYQMMEVLEDTTLQVDDVTEDISDQVVVISSDGKPESSDLTYETLVKLASEAVGQHDEYEGDMIYQVQHGNGKVTHFMLKRKQLKSKENSGDNDTCSKSASGSGSEIKSDEENLKLLTSEELEKQDQLLGKTLKGRNRPVKQMVVKKELQELLDNLKPSDSIEHHVIMETGTKERGWTAGNYRVRGQRMRCKYCDRLLHDRHDFYKHIRTHPEVDYRPYACPLCDYKANIKAAVVRHINIHSEVMPYVCTMCGRGFNFKQKLQTHMKYHKDIRDYQCPNCPLAFHEYKTLKNHIRIIHGPKTLMPSGEEAKGLRHRATALSRLAATRPQHSSEQDSVNVHQIVISEDFMHSANSKVELASNVSVDSRQKVTAVDALPNCASIQSDMPRTSNSEEIKSKEGSLHSNQQVENYASSKSSHDDSNSTTSITGSNMDVENVLSDIMSCSDSERRRLRTSKYIGTKKTQIITERYREGLTKFGASHEEIAASCPWRSSNKSRHCTTRAEHSSSITEHATSVKYHASNQHPGSAELNSVQECIVSGDNTINDAQHPAEEDGNMKQPSAQPSGQENTPVVYIQSLNNTDQPPSHATQKSPFVSLRNLTSTFDEVCQVEKCQNEKEGWLRYRCRRCDKVTFNKTFMVDHIQTAHTDVKLWQCPQCNYKCRLRSSIFVHMKMHEGNKKYKCDQCGKSYTLYSKLKNHLYTHTTNPEFKCEQCDKKFKRRSDLKKHDDRIHNPDRPFRCEVCDKSFKDKVQIKRHMDSHIEGRNLLCQVCKKYYKNRSSLQQHLKSHMCRFYCELCSKSFGSYSGFMAHKVMHTESFTGFHCDLCGKLLHTKGSLNRHLTISHSTARPYPCLQCKSAFKTKKDLRNHAIVHCSTKNFECSVCGFKSKRCESLHVHMRRHQDVKPYRCGICDKEYMQKRSLQLHLPYHLTELQVRCKICNRRCMSRTHLQQHMKREHNSTEAELALIDVPKKSATTFYMCEECNSVFLTQDSLAVHILVQHMNQPHDLKVQLKSANAEIPSGHEDTDERQLAEETESSSNVNTNISDRAGGGVMDPLFNMVNTVDCKDSITQYVAITDPKSKEKRVVTVLRTVGDDMMPVDTAQNVEVEGEVVMNINDDLADISGSMNSAKLEPLPNSQAEENITSMLHNNDDVVVAMPIDAVSMAFVMPKDIDYPQVGDPESIVSFMDPSTNEEFSVALPPQTLVNLLTPAMETEVISSITDEPLSEGGTSLTSVENTAMVSLPDSVSTPNSDSDHPFTSAMEAVDVKDGFQNESAYG